MENNPQLSTHCVRPVVLVSIRSYDTFRKQGRFDKTVHLLYYYLPRKVCEEVNLGYTFIFPFSICLLC